VNEFEVGVLYSLAAGAGSIASGGIAPTSSTTSPLNVVNWGFPDETACPTCLNQGMVSDTLYLCSPAPSIPAHRLASLTAGGLSATGSLPAPTQEVVGGAGPCSLGFWKNRQAEKQGTLDWFPGPQYPAVVAEALVLSGGVFTSATGTGCPNFDDLLCALTSSGERTTEERGLQQLAATLLNLAAISLFPDNNICGLKGGIHITSNACGENLSVATALATAKTGLISGDPVAEHAAMECLGDIANEIGME
jgi:hypothetical protein